jgi:hypothetical protein
MARQIVEKAIKSLHERKSDSFGLLPVSAGSQINSTLTNFADHCEKFSHATINRYLGGEKITPRLVWDTVQGQIVLAPRGSRKRPPGSQTGSPPPSPLRTVGWSALLSGTFPDC